MTLKLVERPALTVVGLQIRTTPMSPDIPALWPHFVARIPEIAGRAEARVTYGVMHDVAAGMASFDYLAGVAVSAAQDLPVGMVSLALPAGPYAAFSFPLSGLAAGFASIFERLLPASGHERVPGQPYFERYGEAFCPNEPDSPVEIYLPVRPRA